MNEQEAFEKALVERCSSKVTTPQDFEAGWKAAIEWTKTRPEYYPNASAVERLRKAIKDGSFDNDVDQYIHIGMEVKRIFTEDGDYFVEVH